MKRWQATHFDFGNQWTLGLQFGPWRKAMRAHVGHHTRVPSLSKRIRMKRTLEHWLASRRRGDSYRARRNLTRRLRHARRSRS